MQEHEREAGPSVSQEHNLNIFPALPEGPQIIEPPTLKPEKKEMFTPPPPPNWQKGCSSWPW